MEKFQLDKYMVESIEFIRSRREFSPISELFSRINGALVSIDHEFEKHNEKILEYFNNLQLVVDEDSLLKCIMGHYEIKTTPEEEILEYYQRMLSDKHSGDYDRKFTGEQGVEAIEFVLEQLGRMDIITKP